MRRSFILLLWLTIVPLCVSDVIAASVTLSWTAPGNNGMVGQATAYDIRYSTVPITDANWALATKVTSPPVPKPAGNRELLKINGLLPGITYYFALKTADSKPNWSSLSNNAVKTTCTGICAGMTGNINGSLDGRTDLSDLMLLVQYLQSPAAASFYTICTEEANVDGSANGVVDLSDLSRLVLFLSSGVPVATCP
ncbi:MAG: fibronectin type III domain-containing protein [Candidatus Zixiibacteriota bacterium]